MKKIILFVGLGLLISFVAEAQYDRRSYGGWIDEDGDCMNTRHEVLLEESLILPTVVGCKVVEGLWYDLYTGKTFTDPKKLDVDHLVPLKEAELSGANLWSNEKKRRYANDLDNPGHLIAVSAGANRSKGAKDIGKWLPENTSFHCAYARMWLVVKEKWGLVVGNNERRAILTALRSCD